MTRGKISPRLKLRDDYQVASMAAVKKTKKRVVAKKKVSLKAKPKAIKKAPLKAKPKAKVKAAPKKAIKSQKKKPLSDKAVKKPAKKAGFLSYLFGEKKQKTSEKKASTSSKSGVKKAKVSAVSQVPSKTVSKETSLEKKAPALKQKTKSAPQEKDLDLETQEELVAALSYEPEPFRGSPLNLKPHKVLTAEGWKRKFES